MKPISVVYNEDASAILSVLPDKMFQTCITSPPYFQLRDYGHPGQIGGEKKIEEYVGRLVDVFSRVKRVLRDDGTLWLNLGDTYARSPSKGRHAAGQSGKHEGAVAKGGARASGFVSANCPEKSLIGVPWRVALALMDDGWVLRNEVIWHKPNGMTEAAHDRLTRAHEQVFLFSKSQSYYFDDVSIMEPTSDGSGMRQKRDVWTVPVARCKEAHFAVYPERLIEPMIASSTGKAECEKCGEQLRPVVKRNRIPTRPGSATKTTGNGEREGNRDRERHITHVEVLGIGTSCDCFGGSIPQNVLDPFLGSGTTAIVANRMGRSCVGIEISPEYAALANRRIMDAASAQ